MTSILTEVKQTGEIWKLSREERLSEVERVAKFLEEGYGSPRLGNPKKPVDDLIYLLISTRTSREVAQRKYQLLRENYDDWKDLKEQKDELRSHLEDSGLAEKKAANIVGSVKAISDRFGEVTLSRLSAWSVDDQIEFLTSLPGVSDKVARCVLLYAFDQPVLPVDTHVHRVTSRLGWTDRSRADQCHDELEALVPDRWRYVFHVGAIEHGRAVCTPRNPNCRECGLKGLCRFYQASNNGTS